MPEVKARQAEEAKAREAARIAAAAALAAGKKLPSQMALEEDSEEEPEPDLEMQVCYFVYCRLLCNTYLSHEEGEVAVKVCTLFMVPATLRQPKCLHFVWLVAYKAVGAGGGQ
jgi:hypothetical protein